MKKKLNSLTITLLFFSVPSFFSTHVEARQNDNLLIKNSYNQLIELYSNREGLSAVERYSSSESFYLKAIRPILTNVDPSNIDGQELEYLFQAIDTITSYTPRVEYVDDMFKVLHHLRLKGLIKKRHYAALQEAYIATRQFEPARNMVEQQKLDYLQIIPEIHAIKNLSPGQPAIWEVEAASLRQRAFSIPQKGPFILVISHPLCGFCAAAAKYISNDEQLKTIFAEHSIWLSAPSGNLALEDYRRWSQVYPKLPVALIHTTPPLPGLNISSTPVFYFFSDGKPSQLITGWPRDGSRAAALTNALADIGFNDANKSILGETESNK